jgi:hypothetical protein
MTVARTGPTSAIRRKKSRNATLVQTTQRAERVSEHDQRHLQDGGHIPAEIQPYQCHHAGESQTETGEASRTERLVGTRQAGEERADERHRGHEQP